MIRYALPVASYVKLRIYDILGREVATVVNGMVPAGYHGIMISSEKLSCGIYFYRIDAGHFIMTRKLVVLK